MTKEQKIEMLINLKNSNGAFTGYTNGFYELIDELIELLKQEPCEDAISRTDLIRKLQAWDTKANGIPNYAWSVINELPSVRPKENIGQENIGHWIQSVVRGTESYICSECYSECCYIPTNYCPTCGSRNIS